MPELFIDPSSGLTPEQGLTSYLGVQGDDYFLSGTDAGREIKTLTDGTTNTVAVVQVENDVAAIWTKPEDWKPDANDPLAGTGRYHAGVFLAGFCDGHVATISHSIDPAAWLAALTIAGEDAAENLDGF